MDQLRNIHQQMLDQGFGGPQTNQEREDLAKTILLLAELEDQMELMDRGEDADRLAFVRHRAMDEWDKA